jgi:hypothetical protein
LYGLKQSPSAWYQHIGSFFTKEGFTRSEADLSLYIKQASEYLLIKDHHQRLAKTTGLPKGNYLQSARVRV